MGSPIRAVRAAASTAAVGNTQDVTVSGETRTPVCAIFHVCNATTDTTWANNNSQGFGATDGTNEFGGTFTSEDNNTVTDAYTRWNTDCVMNVLSITGTEIMRFSTNSFITGGVQLDIDVAATSAFLFDVVFFFEGDFEVGTHTTSASLGGTASQTGMGFDPTFIIPMEWGSFTGPVSFSTTIYAHGRASIGFVSDNPTSGTIQSSTTFYDRDARGTSDVHMYVSSQYGSGWIDSLSATTTAVEYDFVSGGFQSTVRVNATQHNVGYVAGDIPDLDTWAGLITYPTGVTGSQNITEPNVETVAGLIVTDVIRPASVDVWTNGAAASTLGLGMWTYAEQMCLSGVSEHNRPVSDTATYPDASNAIAYGVATGTVKSSADVTASIPSGGFTINIDVAESQIREMPCLAFGPKAEYEAIAETVGITEEIIGLTRQSVDEALDITEEVVALTRQAINEAVDISEEIIGLSRQAIDEALDITEEIVQVVRQLVEEPVDISEQIVQLRRLGIDEAMDVSEDVQLVGVIALGESLGISEEIGDLLAVAVSVVTYFAIESGGVCVDEGESGGPNMVQGEGT